MLHGQAEAWHAIQRGSIRDVIREATLDDAEAIARVHVRSWQTAYKGLLPDELFAGLFTARRRAWWEQQIAQPPPRSRLLVLEHEGAVAGFAGVGPSRDDDPAPETGELYAIYLDPDEWDRGLGRALHEHALAALRDLGFAEATLWVLDTNKRARRFYEKAGWRADGRAKTERAGEGDAELNEVRYRLALTDA